MATQTTVLQQQTIADTGADWSRAVRFAQFDPTLGTLQEVRVSIAAIVDGFRRELESDPSDHQCGTLRLGKRDRRWRCFQRRRNRRRERQREPVGL